MNQQIIKAIKKQWPDASPFYQSLAADNSVVYGWCRPIEAGTKRKPVTKYETVLTRFGAGDEDEQTPETVITRLIHNERLYGTMILDYPDGVTE